MTRELGEYADSLYGADNLETAFGALEKQTQRLGFDSILYTYIPHSLVHSEHAKQPLFQVSENFAPKYLDHYQNARFDQHDPLISAVSDGVSQAIDWRGDICNSYAQNKKSREVIDVAWQYGIKNGITLPLLCDSQGIAGASFITHDKGGFNQLLEERMSELQIMTKMYSYLVQANSAYIGSFIQPVFASLNKLEIRFLAGLASGKSQAAMAAELCRSEKYLEQVMLKMRRKVSGVDRLDRPTINRNQLLYYAGLVNIINHAESL